MVMCCSLVAMNDDLRYDNEIVYCSLTVWVYLPFDWERSERPQTNLIEAVAKFAETQ